MRPVSSRVVTLWITVLCLLASLFSLNVLAAAQPRAGSKHKLSQPLPAAGISTVKRRTKPGAPPPVTTDTWTGGGGANTNWSDAANWNNGAITSGENIAISTTTANTFVDTNFSIGTLTLSNSGDSATINNAVVLTVGGNITNNGTLTVNSGGSTTELVIGASGVTLSGSGTLTMSNNANNYIFGSVAADTLTNSSTIQGSGFLGDNQLTLVNSGTIDATQSNALIVDPSGTATNTGTMEATTGTLVLFGNGGTTTINNAGGTIKATGSDVQLQSSVIISGGTPNTCEAVSV